MQHKGILALMTFIILIIIASTTAASTSNVCKALNALYELRTESFYQQYIADLQPIQSVSGQILTSESIQLLQAQTFDVKKMVVNPRETRVIKTDLVARAPSNIISHTFVDSLLPKDKKDINAENPRALIWALSNVVNVGYEQGQKLRVIHTTVGLTVSALLTPNLKNANYSDVNFLFFDASGSELKSLNDSLGSVAFTYPRDANSEAYYDVNGKVIGHQPTSIEQTAVNVLNDVTPIVYASQDDTIRIRIISASTVQTSSELAPTFHVDFVTLLTTQGSTKLIRYNAVLNGAAVTSLKIVFQTILIPKVVSETNFVNNGNLGGKLEIDQNGRIFVVSNLNKEQRKAFETQNNVELNWADEVSDSAVFMNIDAATGSVLYAENLSLRFTGAAKSSFASSLDIKGNFAVIAGNTINIPRGAAATQFQQAFISKIVLSSKPVQIGNVLLDKANDVGSDTVSKPKFVAHSAVYAVNGFSDQTGNLVTVGGSVVNYGASYIQDGRLLLIDIDPRNQTTRTSLDDMSFEILANNAPEQQEAADNFNLVYNLQVGYSKSNSVTVVKRTSLKVPIDETRYEVKEELVLGCIFDAPVTAEPKPKDKALKFRTVHSGLWQTDCTPQNMRLTVGFSAFFYSVFGVNTFFFLVVIAYSSFSCFWEIKKEKDNERRLIMEGVYF
jgi:hypothetical protein